MVKKGQRTTSIKKGVRGSGVGVRRKDQSPIPNPQFPIPKAVVLLSGGIDSSTTLAIAKSKGYELYALSFDYSQRHKIELESAKKIALALGVKKHLTIKFDLREIGGSALTSGMEVPKSGVRGQGLGVSSKNQSPIPNPQSPIPVTYVPARNTIFLSFALSWAEVLSAENIFIGANAVDYSGYPDCRPEYLKAFEAMANLATKASVEGQMKFRINAPLINMTKAEIIKNGKHLGLDYSLTWSCYDPQPKQLQVKAKAKAEAKAKDFSTLTSTSTLLIPCGRCDSCLFRAKGFKEARIKDPLLR
ncbi:MAG: 7-cyano-7-deazaguanine synthase QueC [Nitrospirae bacterium]|nr:7-cyano-7-deazaguanine synthase QueC [Nitrospirota bacterium]